MVDKRAGSVMTSGLEPSTQDLEEIVDGVEFKKQSSEFQINLRSDEENKATEASTEPTSRVRDLE